MNERYYTQIIANMCETSLKILSNYYDFDSVPKIKNFILPCENKVESSKVVFQEHANDFYIGLQFSKQIFDEFKFLQNKPRFISLNAASVIAEESSHFKLIIDTVLYGGKISILDIETLGEIDRFLCLMHWNQINPMLNIKENWRNIWDICDHVFQGKRFGNENLSLYIRAENHAFNHLKNAFAYEWDYSWHDFSRISARAVNYLRNIRKKILIQHMLNR